MKILTKIGLVLFLFLFSEGFSWSCTKDCIEPFGQVLGGSAVPAYSHCRETCPSLGQNYLEGSAYSGSKWQCVEYARRWLMVNRGVKFGVVKFAHQIWNLSSFEDAKTRTKKQIKKYSNYHSDTPPKIGDLLIYSKKFLGTGHVAVIVGVEPNRVQIAEQNYLNTKWPDPNYSRQLLMTRDKHGFYSVHDEEVLGWMRVQGKNGMRQESVIENRVNKTNYHDALKNAVTDPKLK